MATFRFRFKDVPLGRVGVTEREGDELTYGPEFLCVYATTEGRRVLVYAVPAANVLDVERVRDEAKAASA
jgi:hypothetical protein